MDVASKAARRDPSLAVSAAIFAKSIGSPIGSEILASNAVLYHQSKLVGNEANIVDCIALAQAYMLLDKPDLAAEVLVDGIKRKDDYSLRQSLSRVLVERFKRSIVDETNNFQADFGFLQGAISADPLNPQVGEQIALMLQRDVTVEPGFVEAMQKQLAKARLVPLPCDIGQHCSKKWPV